MQEMSQTNDDLIFGAAGRWVARRISRATVDCDMHSAFEYASDCVKE